MINSTESITQQYTLNPTSNLINGIPDNILALIAPVIAYWIYSLIFHIIDTFELAENYRIHPSEEELQRNKASRFDVLKDVIIQHIIQSIVGYIFVKYDNTNTDNELLPNFFNSSIQLIPIKLIPILLNYLIPFIKISIAFFFIDTWQYSLHKLMHMNKFLYKHFHSRHHRLYVPYAYGALYNDPLEGFCLDTLGTGLAALITSLTPREQIILYTFSTLKTVDDHCGYSLPFDPFQKIFPNNSIYHDIHHQQWGIKTNFSQPFFTFWDQIFNTRFKELDDNDGLNSKITLDKYHQYLLKREENKSLKKANKKLIE
ncbi:hypothetical protein WICMUC_003594 [Wickerhamomyces mucosus]|uniref:Fatty acid hydroxylase domain-containing protein n=1 Tax=Wickerhamomyces mucosus TaxID=1378264 RepID=A0A9P8TBK6_9ASCO|nr:hypothetical protein WICMUC_003594 [Wickerhamomyces mucosus]